MTSYETNKERIRKFQAKKKNRMSNALTRTQQIKPLLTKYSGFYFSFFSHFRLKLFDPILLNSIVDSFDCCARCRQTELCVPIVADWQPAHWIDCDEGQTMFVIDTEIFFVAANITTAQNSSSSAYVWSVRFTLGIVYNKENDKCLINWQNIL